MKRIWMIVPLAVVLLAWVSCTGLKQVRVDRAERLMSVAPDGSRPLKIRGYTRSDAFHQTYHGYVRFAGPDSINFYVVYTQMKGASSPVMRGA